MPPGPERDYFLGVLGNREGRTEESIRLLESVLPSLRASEPQRAAVALEALADNCNKSFRYKDAARAYDDLLTNFPREMEPERLQGRKDDAGVMHLLTGAPAQTIKSARTRSAEDRAKPDKFYQRRADGQWRQGVLAARYGRQFLCRHQNFGPATRAQASAGFAQTTSGTTGIESPLQVAVMPTLELGGAELHNVVVLVLDDTNLKVSLGKDA